MTFANIFPKIILKIRHQTKRFGAEKDDSFISKDNRIRRNVDCGFILYSDVFQSFAIGQKVIDFFYDFLYGFWVLFFVEVFFEIVDHCITFVIEVFI
ncbi:hypothetical protein D3C86_1518530 [compost metagenome]